MKKRAVVLVLTLLLAGVGLQANPISAHPQDGRYRATYYEGARGACGPLVGNYIAINHYKCGARLRITWHGRTVTGYVADRMGAWPSQGCRCIDLAPRIFQQLRIPLSQGVARVHVEHAHA